MDLYAVLGLRRTATLGEIKRAYRRLARKLHPDINPGDRVAAAQFQQISEAYETLTDPDRRRQYDSTGVAAPPAEPTTFGFEGFDFSVSVSGASASTFGDLFADVLQRRGQRGEDAAPERGADLHQTLTVSFDEAMHGAQRAVILTRLEHCRACHGTGRMQTVETRCLHCQGTGIVKSARGHMVFSKPCPSCSASGRQAAIPCFMCNGRQTTMRTEPLSISIPAGVADGARIQIPGMGHSGRNGGEYGDLNVLVRVEPHPFFRRDGDDLTVTVPVAIHEAALGARIDVPAIDGYARVRVPPGAQSGQRFRVRERGAPSLRDGRRGDLIVEIRLVLPKLLDERSKELLREFGRINGDDVRKDMLRE